MQKCMDICSSLHRNVKLSAPVLLLLGVYALMLLFRRFSVLNLRVTMINIIKS